VEVGVTCELGPVECYADAKENKRKKNGRQSSLESDPKD
jgi:hypothetical protein